MSTPTSPKATPFLDTLDERLGRHLDSDGFHRRRGSDPAWKMRVYGSWDATSVAVFVSFDENTDAVLDVELRLLHDYNRQHVAGVVATEQVPVTDTVFADTVARLTALLG